MTPGDAKAVFLDTNILVDAQVRQAPWHQEARQAIAVREQAGVPLWAAAAVRCATLVPAGGRGRGRLAGVQHAGRLTAVCSQTDFLEISR